MFFCSFFLTMTAGMAAQNQKTISYEHHQARILDAVSNAYVQPLVVKLEIDKSIGIEGRISKTYVLSAEKMKSLNNDLSEIHTWGTFQMSKDFGCDVVVAATFSLVGVSGGNFELSVLGFAGKYRDWRPAEKTDEWWIDVVVGRGRTSVQSATSAVGK